MTVVVERTDDLATCLEIRRIVFTEEQGVTPEDEVDGRDGDARHLIARDGARPVGTARILSDGSVGKIGRVAVLKEARGQGVGRDLMLAALAEIRALGLKSAVLGAQVTALEFYARLGFEAEGPEFMDAGIPHRRMVAKL